tara:strand:- start:33014 stop:33754 length:741 start_codon:yes stop_codon:yes gene_type:complete
MKRKIFSISILSLHLLISYPSISQEVIIAVASNFKPAIEKLLEDFGDENITIVSGSSGKLYAQIINGAPYDIFISADQLRPNILVENNLGIKGSQFTIANGRLAIFTINKFSYNDLYDLLSDKEIKFMAVANPATAPYGKASYDFLNNLDFYDLWEGRIAHGENINHTFTMVSTGNAKVGIVSLSQILEKDIEDFFLVPDEFHDPIFQDVVLLKNSERKKLAKRLMDYLRSEKAKNIIKQFGYTIK